MKIHLLLSVFLLFITAFSCQKTETNPDSCPDQLTYEADIKAIINSNCNVTGCHDGVNTKRKPLTDYTGVRAVVNGIKARAVDQKSMPPGGPLSQTDIDRLRCWIEQGAPER